MRSIYLVVLAVWAPIAYASAINVPFGTAGSFAVLAGSTVTSTGPTVIGGDVGVFPGTSITGLTPGMVNGVIHAGDAVALKGQADALTGYNFLAALAPDQNMTGHDLGGLTLTPGVYKFDSSAQLTGALTLNFQGTNDATFVFQTGSTLTTAAASSVVEVNPGRNDHVYFQVGSSATLGTTTALEGDLVALASVTLNTGATIQCGSALAINGAVTLDSNVIHKNSCAAGTATPEPGSMSLFAAGLLGLGGAMRAVRRTLRR